MAGSGGRPAGIFISYRRADASWPARWLADRLASQFGAGVVFQDVDSIRPGDDFTAAIEEAVAACSVLLALIGPRWLAEDGAAGRRLDDPQDWVRLEIEAAMKRGVRIIPVLVDGASMPSAGELPPSLRTLVRKQAVTLSPVSLDTRSLVSVLETALAQEGKPARHARTQTPQPARPTASRLLLSAVQEASMLTGKDKSEALCAAIDAAVLIAPERVSWLITEAETTADSIADASLRSSALAQVAGAVAEADPERGEAIARSIQKASDRSFALGSVAAVVAKFDPERGEAIARSTLQPYELTRVAAAAAEADPERGEAIARSIQKASDQSLALAGVAAATAETDPERAGWLIAQAETIARSLEGAFGRSAALANVAAAAVAADPGRAGWLIAQAETVARSVEDADRLPVALALVVMTAAEADPKRSEAIAYSIGERYWRSLALAQVAAVVAETDPTRGEAIARSLANAAQRSSTLGRVAAAVVKADPDRAEAIARSIPDATSRSYALANLARLLAWQASRG
jgi:hypothetical protein